jgi:hypothetical protein
MEPMKQYRQVLKEMPKSSIVYAVEDFSIPNYQSDIIIKTAQRFAESSSSSCVIFICNESILSLDTKLRYMQGLYPNINFIKTSNLSESIDNLKTKYKSIVQAPSNISENTNINKMIKLAEGGDYTEFKRHLPINMRDINGKRLMNEVRQGLGLDIIKEHIKLNFDELRERYYKKEIFNIGDIVESNNESFEILDRGSNYLVLVNSNGQTSKKWIQDVLMSENQTYTNNQFQDAPDVLDPLEITFKGYKTKNLHNAPGAAEAFRKTIRNIGTFDPASVLNALKATDEYLKITPADVLKGGKENQADLLKWSNNHLKAKQALDKQGEFVFHADYWYSYKDLLDKAVYAVRIITSDNPISDLDESTMDPNKDKLKVAKMIASVLGVDDTEKSNNPENLVNSALRKSKSLPKDSLKIVTKMLKLADEVGINYDRKIIKATHTLTTEQVELAEARAEKYGRKYPNAIDSAWAIAESRTPSIVASKTKPNLSSLRPDDEKKLVTLNNLGKGANVPSGDLNPKYKKEIENYANTGHTNGIEQSPGKNQPEVTHVGASLTANGDDTMARMKAKKIMGEDFTEEELDEWIDSVTEEDIFETYDIDDFIIIDEDGNEVIIEENVNEEALNEVLSKMERIKAKLRMAKYEPKLTAKREIALRKHSDSHAINNRARHLAVSMFKKKMLKGRDPSKLSSTEHERIDRIIEKKKKLIGRLALKLTSKVRQTEKNRLSHH